MVTDFLTPTFNKNFVWKIIFEKKILFFFFKNYTVFLVQGGESPNGPKLSGHVMRTNFKITRLQNCKNEPFTLKWAICNFNQNVRPPKTQKWATLKLVCIFGEFWDCPV